MTNQNQSKPSKCSYWLSGLSEFSYWSTISMDEGGSRKYYDFDVLVNAPYSSPLSCYDLQVCELCEASGVVIQPESYGNDYENLTFGIFATKQFVKGEVIMDCGSATITQEEVCLAMIPSTPKGPARHILSYICFGTHSGTHLTDSANDDLEYIDLLALRHPILFLNSASHARGNVPNVKFGKRKAAKKGGKPTIVIRATKTINPGDELLEDYWDDDDFEKTKYYRSAKN